MRKPIIILIVILCTALLTAWALGLGPVLSTNWPDEQSDPSPKTVTLGTDASATITGSEDASTRSLVRSTSSEIPAAVSELAPFELRVLEFGTETPVVGAELWFLDLTKAEIRDDFDESVRRNNLRESNLETYLQSFGAKTRSDEQGRCQILRGGHVRVVARQGDLYGEATLEESTANESVLYLRPDQVLRVRVVDAERLPARGVDVVFVYTREDGARAQKRLGRTDEAGLFQRAHLQIFADDRSVFPVEIAASPVGGLSSAVPINLIEPPAAVIELTLPPTGSISIRRVDSLGTPLKQPNLPGYENWLRMSVVGERRPFWSTRIGEGGRYDFPYVSLGKRFSVAWRMPGLMAFQFDGPRAAQRRIAIDMPLPETCAFVVGRALSSDGKVLAKRSLVMQCRVGELTGFGFGRTDEAGRFELAVSGLVEGAVPSVNFMVKSNKPDGVRLRRFFVCREPWRPGRNQLGDITVGLGEILARGIVESPGGVDVGEPYLGLEFHDGSAWQWMPVTLSWPKPGEFELRGDAPTTRLRVNRADGHYMPMEPVEFVPGAEDLRLQLVKGGTLNLALLVGPSTPWHELSYELTSMSAGESDEALAVPRLIAKGSEITGSWGTLHAGRYRLRVQMPQLEDPLILIEDIEVRAGAIVRDPRLNPLDLRSLVNRVQVDVQNEAGEPIGDDDAMVLVSRASGQSRRAYFLKQGQAFVPITKEVDLIVLAPGFQPRSLRAVREDVRVTLYPSQGLEFAVALPTALPKGVSARLRLLPDGANPLAEALSGGFRQLRGSRGSRYYPRKPKMIASLAGVRLDASGRARLMLRHAGLFRAELSLLQDGQETSVPVALRESRVEWLAAEQETINLTVTPPALQAAIRQLLR